MLDVTIVALDGRYRWTLVRRVPHGADVVARGVDWYPDEQSCRRGAERIWYAAPEAILAVQQPDGGWRWRLPGPDGAPLAESAQTFADARSCGRAVALLRGDLAGPGRHRAARADTH